MALTKTPIELSSTPSIVDNGNATAITIGSDESATFAGPVQLTAGALAAAGNAGLSHRSADNKVYLQAGTGGFNILDDQQNTHFFIDSAGVSSFYGNVGIGTASPTTALDVSGAVTVTRSDVADDHSTISNEGGLFVISAATGGGGGTYPMLFKTANTEAMRIDSSGNLVVGGTSLNAASSVGFTAAGQIRQVFASGVANDSLFGAISGVSNGFQITQDASNNQSYLFHNGGTPSVTINSSGNVGIGTSSPDAGMKLDVRGNARIGDGTAAEQDILFSNSTTDWQVGTNNAGNGTDSNHFYFWEGSNYRLTIQKGGKVGIGTPAPDAHLHAISGAAGTGVKLETSSGQFTVQGSDAGGTYIEQTGTTAATRKFRLQNQDGSNNYTQVVIDGANQRVEVIPALDVHKGAVWSETAQGTGKGTIHLDPAITTDHAGSSITFGASDHGNGQAAHAGIYTRTDGGYGSKLYLATTDSYAAGSKTALSINHYGHVDLPRGYITSQVPAFNAYHNANAYVPATSTVFAHNTVRYNNGGHFNTSTYSFTAPISGIYHFHFHTIYYGNGSNAHVSFRVNGSGQSGTNSHFSADEGAVWHTINITANLDLAENDYVDVFSNNMGGLTYLHGTTWNEFSGYLVG